MDFSSPIQMIVQTTLYKGCLYSSVTTVPSSLVCSPSGSSGSSTSSWDSGYNDVTTVQSSVAAALGYNTVATMSSLLVHSPSGASRVSSASSWDPGYNSLTVVPSSLVHSPSGTTRVPSAFSRDSGYNNVTPVLSSVGRSASKVSSQVSPVSSSAPGYNNVSISTPVEADSSPAAVRSPYSIVELITMAIKDSPEKLLTLREICAYIHKRFPHCAKKVGWQKSIRNKLSLGEWFVKVRRNGEDEKKGNYWMIHPDFGDMFQNDNNRRRKKMKRPYRRKSSLSKGYFSHPYTSPFCLNTNGFFSPLAYGAASSAATWTFPRIQNSPHLAYPSCQRMAASPQDLHTTYAHVQSTPLEPTAAAQSYPYSHVQSTPLQPIRQAATQHTIHYFPIGTSCGTQGTTFVGH